MLPFLLLLLSQSFVLELQTFHLPLEAAGQELVLPGLIGLELGHEFTQLCCFALLFSQLGFEPSVLVSEHLDGAAGRFALVLRGAVAVHARD